jgi:ankyrin repeat protein
LIRLVAILIENSANVNAQQSNLHNALDCASFIGFTDIAALLIKHGADVNARGSPLGGPEDSALRIASSKGHEELARMLRECGTVKFGEAAPLVVWIPLAGL